VADTATLGLRDADAVGSRLGESVGLGDAAEVSAADELAAATWLDCAVGPVDALT